jgi:hypothetical protein
VNARLASRSTLHEVPITATGEGIMQCRFGGVKIAEQGGHGGKKLPSFGAVEGEQVEAADRLDADRRR